MEIKINQSSTTVKFDDLCAFDIFVHNDKVYIKSALDAAVRVGGKYGELFNKYCQVFPCKKVEVTV